MLLWRAWNVLLWLWRLDWVETLKTGFIFVIGTIYAAMLGGIIVAGIWIYATSKAKAHSFYPQECCSGHDCAPVPSRRVDVVAGGYLIDRLHFVPEFQARVSPDKQFHGCFPTASILRCFFAPKPSM